MKVEKGRPIHCDGRLQKEIRSYDFLDNLKITYERVDHPITDTMNACAEIDSILDAPTCKNLLLCNRQKTSFYLLMLPGDKQFKTSVLSKEIGSSRLSFADGHYMEQFLDITPGSLSILGLTQDVDNQVQLLIDKDILKDTYFGCHPCINTTTIKIRTEDLIQKIIPALNHIPIYVDLPWET